MRSSLTRPLSGLLLLLRLRSHCILKCGIRSFREDGHCAALASPPGDGTRLRADAGPVFGTSPRCRRRREPFHLPWSLLLNVCWNAVVYLFSPRSALAFAPLMTTQVTSPSPIHAHPKSFA